MPGARITGPDIGQVMGRIGMSIRGGTLETLTLASLEAKKIEQREIQKASGGDMRMSGVGRARGRQGNAKVGVRYDIRGGEVPWSKIKATGPLHLLERDTGGRVIRSAYLRGAGRKYSGQKAPIQGPGLMGRNFRGDRRAVLNIPGIGYRRSARHPGTKGKHPFAIGQKKAIKPVQRIMRQRTFRVIKKAAKP